MKRNVLVSVFYLPPTLSPLPSTYIPFSLVIDDVEFRIDGVEAIEFLCREASERIIEYYGYEVPIRDVVIMGFQFLEDPI